MSNMTESILYQRYVNPFFTQHGWFTHRFEHPQIPDVYCAKTGYVIWIELKVVNSHQKIIKPSWRPGQLAWIKRHEERGGSIIFLALWYIDNWFLLIPKEQYEELEPLPLYMFTRPMV